MFSRNRSCGSIVQVNCGALQFTWRSVRLHQQTKPWGPILAPALAQKLIYAAVCPLYIPGACILYTSRQKAARIPAGPCADVTIKWQAIFRCWLCGARDSSITRVPAQKRPLRALAAAPAAPKCVVDWLKNPHTQNRLRVRAAFRSLGSARGLFLQPFCSLTRKGRWTNLFMFYFGHFLLAFNFIPFQIILKLPIMF